MTQRVAEAMASNHLWGEQITYLSLASQQRKRKTARIQIQRESRDRENTETERKRETDKQTDRQADIKRQRQTERWKQKISFSNRTLENASTTLAVVKTIRLLHSELHLQLCIHIRYTKENYLPTVELKIYHFLTKPFDQRVVGSNPALAVT